jgi:hypothetical protein
MKSGQGKFCFIGSEAAAPTGFWNKLKDFC